MLQLFKSKCWRDGLLLIADAIATVASTAISLQEISKCFNIDSFITLEVIFIRRSPDNLQFDRIKCCNITLLSVTSDIALTIRSAA